MINLKDYTLVELKKLDTQVQRELEKRQDAARKALARDFRKLAAEKGIDAREILAEVSREPKSPKKGTKIKKAKSELLYWNPIDPSQGWSGRGRKPNWVINYLENGGALESLKKQ